MAEEKDPIEPKEIIKQPEQAVVVGSSKELEVVPKNLPETSKLADNKTESPEETEAEHLTERPVKKKSKTKKVKKISTKIKPKKSKQYNEKLKLIDPEKSYPLAEAVALVKQLSYVKFDATIELHLKLGVDPTKADQRVRGTVTLPNGTGKVMRVLVFAQGEKVEEAKNAGADYAGLDDLIDKILDGWLEFDIVVATPDVMAKIAKLGKILGTKGMMPNPKSGTITFDLEQIVSGLKAGLVEYKLEKLPLIHTIIGKVSFTDQQILENAKTLLAAIMAARPSTSKGIYLQSAFMNATMTPSIKLDLLELRSIKA